MQADHILVIDQGTTSSRVIIYDRSLQPITSEAKEFTQYFPHPGWVEHDAAEIWRDVQVLIQNTLKKAALTWGNIASIGITNQRETVVVWDKETGKPVHNAIVWQDRRTANYCENLKKDGHETAVQAKTGLLLDPYFSASKIRWILDHIGAGQNRANRGEICAGTIDTWLIWNLTKGAAHSTDATNASRTSLCNIHTGAWDPDLLALFDIPETLLPRILNCADDFGITPQGVPITGVAGDQQAAAIGQCCFDKGMIKSTYGTGCFALLNTGPTPVMSQNKLLSTIAYQLDDVRHYALEGSIFIAGAAIQWLRDAVKFIDAAKDVDRLAAMATENNVIFVPAFTGLGAPYWNATCEGAIFGLNRNTGQAEISHAALMSIGYQTRDLLQAMRADCPDLLITSLRVDGGLSKSTLAMQSIADQLGIPVDRAAISESTALGAAYLAGLKPKISPSPEEFQNNWMSDHRFAPKQARDSANVHYAKWQQMVRKLLTD
ncbi:MAG: glycerol kinase GlpK [Halocynthiibacter sp.]